MTEKAAQSPLNCLELWRTRKRSQRNEVLFRQADWFPHQVNILRRIGTLLNNGKVVCHCLILSQAVFLAFLTKEATWCAPKPPQLLCRSVVQVRRDGQFVGGANPVFHPQSIPPCWGPAVPALGIGLPPPGERRVVVNTEQAPSIAVLTRSSSRFLPSWEHLEMPRFDKFPWDTWNLASAMKFWEVPENSNEASK